jgi:cytidyltransferase-like protein
MPLPWHVERKDPHHPPLWPDRTKESPALNASASDTAAYPGSFNPITHGHLGIIRRIRLLFSSLIVLVASNPNKRPRQEIKLRAELVRCGLGQ